MNSNQFRRETRLAKNELESYGFNQNAAVRSGPWIFVALVSLFAISLALVSHLLPSGLSTPQVGTLVIALGAFTLGYHQWREARNETSMDRFYDRLELADRRLDAWPAARAMVQHFWPAVTDQQSYECSMYVYVELDNLEYVIEKYKLGYMTAAQALRGFRTFQSRCESSMFRNLALQYVRCAGYSPTTIEVVDRTCKDCGSKDKLSGEQVISTSATEVTGSFLSIK